ncbi:MAG: hypothetical protein H6673_06525 [Anaerolineales bacterium]|nr:hypothetical protein [Anaerolineales bacterium]
MEARKLVERAILEDTQASLPIIGTDIMREFSIGPGRRVGELLKRAIDIFDVNPSLSKSDLLLQLQESLTV